MAGITDAELLAVKRFMRVDHDEDDDVIAALYAAAGAYLREGGAERPPEDPELHDLALWALTLHWYDHRDDVGSEAALPAGLRLIIGQLKRDAEIRRSLGS